MVSSSPGSGQLKAYFNGVGSGGGWDAIIGGATGYGLSHIIRRGYAWLSANFEEGDEIFLLGFSRGAYSARSLAGLIRKCGILRREEVHMTDAAYDIYRKRDEGPDSREAILFRGACSREADIRFLGVWDTVGALGIPLFVLKKLNESVLFSFHDTELSRIVKNAFHAVAIDEHRQDFEVALWNSDRKKEGQRIEQRWFVGAHSDVGGGYEDRRLSDITLKWMCERAMECGLSFRGGVETQAGYCLAPFHKPWNRILYFFRFRLVRPMGRTRNGSETVDESVLERWKSPGAGYCPENMGFRDFIPSENLPA